MLFSIFITFAALVTLFLTVGAARESIMSIHELDFADILIEGLFTGCVGSVGIFSLFAVWM